MSKERDEIKLDKARIEFLSDGVIAIVITLMALEIPVPESITFASMLQLGENIGIYFISFVVVGAFWNRHHFAFMHIKEVTKQVISVNMLFLFFISLLPFVTKMTIEHTDNIVPAIMFNCVYLLAQFCYLFIVRYAFINTENSELKELLKQRQERDKHQFKHMWVPFIVMILIILAVIGCLVFITDISIYFLLWLPVIFSIYNLFFSNDRQNRKKRIRKATGHVNEFESK